MKQSRLDSKEREFFRTVYHAAFANPFGAVREKLDHKLSGLFPSASRRESTDRCIQEVGRKIKELEKRDRGTINAFRGQDRSIMAIVFLFDIFHKFRDRFDSLIMEQIKAGDEPVKVTFADEAMSMLHRRGFEGDTLLHYFALSYQLRRAFYFISNSLVGSSPCMKNLKKHLWNNVFTHNIEFYDKFMWNRMEDFSTLLLGETGTGKGTAAMAIGRSGFIPFSEKTGTFQESFTRAFSSLNLSQFPEALLESELFGHKKGSFTGAVEDYKGVFDRCSPYGSILLDEIGEIPNHVQIKLLQVLQDRVFTPVGSHSTGRFHGRVIAATNKSIKSILNGEVFRDDFYYRLCSDIIKVPPLRERIREDPGELDDLLEFTVERMTGTRSEKLISRIKRVIQKELGPEYHWPGNVRELEQCVRSVLLRRTYKGGDEPSQSPETLTETLVNGIREKSMDIPALVSGYCTLLYEKHGTYEKVARETGMDRRTVKKYINGS
ncbi:MAG: sigma 54-interacting transcriptional regulator [Desulfobacteraceae bacterium]